MARILALDYGIKRTGIAETDDLQLIAAPLTTVPTADLKKWLQAYCARYRVSEVLLGHPGEEGRAQETALRVNDLAAQIRKWFPSIPVVLWDERFTSRMALDAMLAAGSTRAQRRDKGNIDKISAAIILREYLESKKRNLP